MVSSLIDSDLCCWKMGSLKELFGESDVAHIASIPISRVVLEDKLVWNAEKHGDFSVKTSYHLLGNARRSNNPGPSARDEDGFWKLLWKAPIENKIKEFLWRLVKNILPLRTNVCKKGISLDPSCPLCFEEAESAAHLFLRCDFIKRMLFAPPLGIRIPPVDDVMVWLLRTFRYKDTRLCQVLCIGLWKVWKARNDAVFNKVRPCPMLVAKDVWLSVTEFDCSRSVTMDRLMPALVENSYGNAWIIQTDAGCFEGGTVALGCVIKSAKHGILLAATQRFPSFVNPDAAEALGIRWGMQLANDFNLEEVMFQSDALGVVDCVNGVCSLPDIEPIVLDCCLLRNHFKFSSVMFIGRESNTDAHNMVGIGKLVGSRTWLGVIPLIEEIRVSLAISVLS
ncbi:uncharacterized protein LOC131598327 [Vicia villosa]|uniref:uncharacterized protein LOC131598327 n=1 Tax=Vicia villosa TaxID=3911 RepID=UPI00273B6D65|nr:uncharacterized protein LOC131598327 [Vicia villosa]